MTAPKFVMHDGVRWRVNAEITIDDEPGYELSRRVPVVKKLGNDIVERTVKSIRLDARARDCDPDQHEPVRVFRDSKAVVRFYPKRGIVKVSVPHGRTKYETTLVGILQMCARAEASRRARDKAFAKRTRRRS